MIARVMREVLVLERALHTLRAVQAVERRMIATEIDRLAFDALPRGAEGLDGQHHDHLRLRIGRFRLLYKLTESELTVVALLTD